MSRLRQSLFSGQARYQFRQPSHVGGGARNRTESAAFKELPHSKRTPRRDGRPAGSRTPILLGLNEASLPRFLYRAMVGMRGIEPREPKRPLYRRLQRRTGIHTHVWCAHPDSNWECLRHLKAASLPWFLYGRMVGLRGFEPRNGAGLSCAAVPVRDSPIKWCAPSDSNRETARFELAR